MSVMFNMFMSDSTPSTITAGTPQVIDTVGAAAAMSVISLSSTKAIAVYSNSLGIRAVVLDVSGTSVTVNSIASLNASNAGQITSIGYVSATQVVAGYGASKAMVLDISGSAITTNSELTITNSTRYVSIIPFDSTHVVALYAASAPNYIESRILTISGSTLSQNTATAVSTTSTANQTIGKLLNSSQALIGFVESTNTVKLMILDLSGTTVTANTATTLTNAVSIAAGSGPSLGLGANNTTKLTTIYNKFGEVGVATRAITISGSTVSIGSETVIDATAVPPVSAIGLDTDNAMALYTPAGGAGDAIIISTVSPIAVSTATQFDAGTTRYASVCALSATKCLAVYSDGGNSQYPTAVVLDIA